MSSTYRVICASHTPALEILAPDWTSPGDVVYAAFNREAELPEHVGCLLYVGEYSYPLVEVACAGGPDSGCSHLNVEWQDVDALRLVLYGLDAAKNSPLREAARSLARGCWSPDRLALLRPLLLGQDR